MKLILAALLGLASAHQSFNGGEDFAPHWEPPTWVNSDDPNGIKLGGGAGSTTGRGPLRTNDYRGAEQDDNFMSKDDDRRVWAPAYDDHHSYQHHPVAHKYSDEHLMDDEGRSTRVIHGQDTSQHVNRRTKKKVFDTIKEPKHHFAVQSIDVPFPFHHHYYNHTKVHYHDGYDLYDDDVGDSEKYYHVNPDTHTNVDGWFADDHYRVSSEAFSDDGATEDDGFMAVRREGAGDFQRRGPSLTGQSQAGSQADWRRNPSSTARAPGAMSGDAADWIFGRPPRATGDFNRAYPGGPAVSADGWGN